MTKEEIAQYIKSQLANDDPEIYLDIDDYKTIVKALEQEPKQKVLDKIRAKIEEGYCTVNNAYDHGRNYGLYMATQIIDEYKAESKDT